MILISVLYQNASTSQILEASPQGLISSYRIKKSCTLISTLKLKYRFLIGSDLRKIIHCATYVQWLCVWDNARFLLRILKAQSFNFFSAYTFWPYFLDTNKFGDNWPIVLSMWHFRKNLYNEDDVYTKICISGY